MWIHNSPHEHVITKKYVKICNPSIIGMYLGLVQRQ